MNPTGEHLQRGRRPWTEADTAHLLAHYQTRQLRDIAMDLGRRPGNVSAKLGRLVQAGLASYSERAYLPEWTEAELRFAQEKIGTPGWSYEALGRVLDRTPEAVKLRLKRAGVRRPVTTPTARTLSLREVAEVTGLGEHWRPVRAWLDAKLLKGSRVPTTGDAARRRWVIYPADLVAFLQAHPDRYDARLMPATFRGAPNPYRQYARRVDPLAGWLTRKQAAKELGVASGTLKVWDGQERIRSESRTGPGVNRQERFYARAEVDRAKARLVRLKNGWWTLPVESTP